MDAEAPPGLWLVDKPAGPTSHDIVAGVRRRLGGRKVKVGHAGTLDPFATGLLVVLVGRATRLAPYLSGLDKSYLATVRLGATSATGDPEGPVLETGEAPDRARVEAVLPSFLGRQRQRVPAMSAVKVDGERLYRKARRGEAVEAPEREIAIHEIRLVDDPSAPAGAVTLAVRCSKGTYLRQLAADLGERLGCGGYCHALRRTMVGALSVDDAVAPEEVTRGGGIGLLAGLAHLPARPLSDAETALVRHGRPVTGAPPTEGPVALVAEDRLVAVAHPDGEGALRPAVVLG
jgi:tRNA pseudouridine55 synthase